jgi:hypothetical protein
MSSFLPAAVAAAASCSALAWHPRSVVSMISASDVVIDDLERWFVECFDTAKIRKRGRLEYDVTTNLIAVKQSQEFVLSHWSRSVGR